MNCANHPDIPVAAYCQNCGKGLCTNCVRSVSGVIYCEPCLAARLGIGGRGVGPGSGPGVAMPGVVAPGVIAPSGPNPGTAFALGFIPGVGAMYNGQFVKGLVHVLIFVILVGIAQDHGIFGIFVAAWVAYQVFDAYQTAKAKRDGHPLPDPFGLNELGTKLGIPNPLGGSGVAQGFPGVHVPPPPPPPGGFGSGPGSGFASGSGFGSGAGAGFGTGSGPVAGFTPVDPYAPYSAPPPPPVPPVPPGIDPTVPPSCSSRGNEPIGAMVLIGLGVLFLLNTLDVFHFNWIGRLWPLLIIAFGAMLFVRRTREIPPPPPPPPPPGGAL
jgi:TM2 domain-containing membrane protein YozV